MVIITNRNKSEERSRAQRIKSWHEATGLTKCHQITFEASGFMMAIMIQMIAKKVRAQLEQRVITVQQNKPQIE